MIDSYKKYDVVILTHAPKDMLIKSLKALNSQIVKPDKIIIYNTDENLFYKNISDRMTFDELLKNCEVYHIKECDFDHGKTRNDAEAKCKGDYVLFLTDDAVPYDESLTKNLLNGFNYEEDKVALVYARQIPKDDATLKEKIIREFNYPDYDIVKDRSAETKLGIKNYYCSNVCAMYDRRIFEKLGRFEENIILNEDTFYIYNAINKGYKAIYKSSAKVIHSHNLSYKEQFSRNFDIGVSQKERKEIFDRINSVSEGKKLLIYAIKRLLKGLHFISCIDFVIDCAYRYMGFKTGYKFESLSIDKCISYASNKNYFRKKK